MFCTHDCNLKKILCDYFVFSETPITCPCSESVTNLGHNDEQRNRFIREKYCK